MPISSEELFNVLDEASEKTFLCAGTVLSLQKYIFDVEAVKKALEIKNIVACTSFLIEIELVKAWLVDKDAEALRCQKMLVDEEEAANRRRAEILEKKRLKKLRQKEHKMKESSSGEKAGIKTPSLDSPPDSAGSPDTSSPRASSEDYTSEPSEIQEQQFFESAESSAAEDDMNAEKSRNNHEQTENQNSGHCGKRTDLQLPVDPVRENVSRIQRGTTHVQQSYLWHANSRQNQNNTHGFQAANNSASKPLVTTRESNSRDSKVKANGRKIWTIKSKPDNEHRERNCRDVENREVLIGSINVSLESGDLHNSYTVSEPQSEDKLVKPDSSSSCFNKTSTKFWRPVSRHGNGISFQNDCENVEVDAHAASVTELDRHEESREGAMIFSSEAIKAFLAQRWKEAVAGDDVVFISPPDTESSGSCDAIGGSIPSSSPQTTDFHVRNVLGRVENRLAGAAALDADASTGSWQFKSRPKTEKSSRLKYVPKQSSVGAEE